MAKDSKWMQKAVKRPGAMTARAKRKGHSMSEQIKIDSKSGTPREKKQANLAKTFRKMASKRKSK